MLAGYRVLVVEDEALVASTISELLTEAEGVPVGPAASVCEARRLIRDGPAGYGPINADLYRRTAYYVEWILQGAAPGQTPIEGPSHLRLVVNAKTARALRIKVPEVLLLQADEVIE